MPKCITCAAIGEDAPVDQDKATEQGLTSTYQGKTYYFHNLEEKQKFDQNPEHFIKQAKQQGLVA